MFSMSGNDFANTLSGFSNATDNDVYLMQAVEVGQDVSFGTATFTSVAATDEDVPITFASLAFSSVAVDGNGILQGIRVETLPNNSTLKLDGTNLSVGEVLDTDDLEKILFTPQSNWPTAHGSDVSSWSFSAVYSRETVAGISYMYAVPGNTFNVTVSALNDTPTLSGNNSTSVNEDSSVVLSNSLFSSKYRDVDGDTFTSINVLSLPSNGVLSLSGTPVSINQIISSGDLDVSGLIFTPDPDFPSPSASATVSFNWSASNDFGETSNERTLTITARDTPDPPVIFDDGAIANGGVPVVVDILANDTDPLGAREPSTHPGSYTIEIVEAPAHGSLVIENQKLTYLADNIAGPVRIRYRLNNGELSNVATLTVDVSFNEFFGKALVDKLGDENDGSTEPGDLTLREALNLVVENNIEELAFADGLANQTITLDPALGPLVIDKDIVIDGGNSLTISGGEATSIFKIISGNVVIKNITLKDGLAKGGDGGAPGHFNFYGGGGGGAGMGGAIAINGGSVTIDSVNFVGNKAKGGNGSSYGPVNSGDNYGGRGGSGVFGGGANVTYNGQTPVSGGFGGGGAGSMTNSNSGRKHAGAGGIGGGGGSSSSGLWTSDARGGRYLSGNGGVAGLFGGAGVGKTEISR